MYQKKKKKRERGTIHGGGQEPAPGPYERRKRIISESGWTTGDHKALCG